jgi:hypothetical protein
VIKGLLAKSEQTHQGRKTDPYAFAQELVVASQLVAACRIAPMYHRPEASVFLKTGSVLICNLTGIATPTNNGRTRPLKVFCEAPDGTEFEAFLKGPHFAEKPFPCLLEREWMAARLACQLGLPCALPLKIHLDPEVVASEQNHALRTRLQSGPEILFGSLNSGPGWSVWTDATPLPRTHAQTAAEIYVFDTIIQNWDRSVENPNLLVKGDKLLMIDHGEAFVEATGADAEREFPPPPWRLGGVVNHEGTYETHPLWPKLRPKSSIDFLAATDRWKALPEDTFNLMAADVPDCWTTETAMQIAAYLAFAVENVDKILANIEYNFER